MSALSDKPFRIVDYIPYARLGQVGEGNWTLDAALTGGEYQELATSPTQGTWLYQSQIDIAGWTKEGLTAFFANLFSQRAAPYYTNYAVSPMGGVVLQDVILVTDVPLPDATTVGGTFAGMPRGQSDYMTVKYATGSQRVQTISAPTNLVENDAWGYGSADPTASGTLYVYRYIIVQVPVASTPSVVVDFPTIRCVLEGVATEEPEFVYLTRLRRSYELRENG
jgi:hypothetical protein